MPDPCLTLDDLIAAGNWSGTALESRQLMAGYTVDGGRFGSMPLETKSGSSNDTHLGKRVSEIWTAALVFSYLGYHKIGLISVGQDGAQLERPDFDVQLPDGEYIGLEIANVSETLERKLEAGRNAIEVSLRDRIERDSAFRAAFGSYYITLTLSGPGSHAQDLTRRETRAIIEDLVRFVSAGAHTKVSSEYFSPFSAQYKTLNMRGAEYHAEPIADGPSFTVNEGAGTIGPTDRRDDVIHAIREEIKRQGLTREKAAKKVKLAQPDLSQILNGRASNYSAERLQRVLQDLGRNIEGSGRESPSTK